MTEWQYKVVDLTLLADERGLVNSDKLQRTLCIYGESGWELVTVDLQAGVAVFKRPEEYR